VVWVKLDDGFPEHPKVAGLSDDAFRTHVEFLCYCARRLTDGLIPKRLAESQAACQELLDAGVWDRGEDGSVWVHDYLDMNPSKKTVLHLRKVRSEAGQRGAEKTNRARSAASAAANDAASAPANAAANARQNSRPETRVPIPEPHDPEPAPESTDEISESSSDDSSSVSADFIAGTDRVSAEQPKQPREAASRSAGEHVGPSTPPEGGRNEKPVQRASGPSESKARNGAVTRADMDRFVSLWRGLVTGTDIRPINPSPTRHADGIRRWLKAVGRSGGDWRWPKITLAIRWFVDRGLTKDSGEPYGLPTFLRASHVKDYLTEAETWDERGRPPHCSKQRKSDELQRIIDALPDHGESG